MPAPPPTSRRKLVLSAGAGIVAGSIWGAALQAVATPSVPTLSVIGKQETQLVLLDTTGVRALILLGMPDDDLQLQIPALMTMFRQRIDLLVGSSPAIAALGVDFQRRWRVSQSLVLPESHRTRRDTRNEIRIDQDVSIDLDNSISLDFRVTTRNDWSAAGETSRLWMITVRSPTTTVALAPNQASAEVLGDFGMALLAVPAASPDRLMSRLNPTSVAINARDDVSISGGRERSGYLVRIYPEDIARFEFRDAGVSLPYWAEESN